MTVAVLEVTTAQVGGGAHVYSVKRAIIALAESRADTMANPHHLLRLLVPQVDGLIP